MAAPNVGLLAGLNVKSNYGNLINQEVAAQRYNQAQEDNWFNGLQKQQQMDTQMSMQAQQDMAAAQAAANKVPIFDRDVKELQKYDEDLKEKIFAEPVKQFGGDLSELLKSDKGRAALRKYMSELYNNPKLKDYQRRADFVANHIASSKAGNEALDYYSPELKQWLTPQQQIEAFEAGQLSDLTPHDYQKMQKPFNAIEYFSKIPVPTDREDEYYKMDGRLPVDSDTFARTYVENKFPKVAENPESARYQEYYNRAKQLYKESEKKPFYKAMEMEALRREQIKRNIDYTKAKTYKLFNDGQQPPSNAYVAQPVTVRINLGESDNEDAGNSIHEAHGSTISLPIPKTASNMNFIATKVFYPEQQGEKKVGNRTSKIVTPSSYSYNIGVKIPDQPQLAAFRVNENGQIDNTGEHISLFVPVIGENNKLGLAPYSDASGIVYKLTNGMPFDKLYEMATRNIPEKGMDVNEAVNRQLHLNSGAGVETGVLQSGIKYTVEQAQ